MSVQIVRNNKSSLPVQFLDQNDDPIDITNYIVVLTVKNQKDLSKNNDDLAILQKVNNVGEHSDPTNGETIFELSAVETSINQGCYIADLRLIDGSDIVNTLEFKFEVIQNVTNITTITP